MTRCGLATNHPARQQRPMAPLPESHSQEVGPPAEAQGQHPSCQDIHDVETRLLPSSTSLPDVGSSQVYQVINHYENLRLGCTADDGLTVGECGLI